MAWASELPAELLHKPSGLVALTGLDTTYNAVHKAIWDSFCNNRRADRLPLNFRVFPIDHEYPKCKTKRSNYEPYIPKGILKYDWMRKHLEAVPAVVVVFFDLDWDDAIWKEKQMGCSTKIEIVRNSLLHRGTRVCVVLIQKNAPLPPGEDVQAAERAASLCTACELSAKSLFVLPLTDHLLGYTIRLENAFYEMVQGYYHTEARRVKAHKDFLNKTTHQLLYVRHQFKIAFYSELKQDTHTALKHYKQAYGHVLETVMHDSNLLEVKTIAGFINYKVCRLSFQHNTPLDSIAQFRKHIDFFKDRVGPMELAFEHSAWMSKQFQIFGDLFDEAIKLGLTAIQTQHPGFYFQQAANHARARKLHAQQYCQEKDGSNTNQSVLAGLGKLEFFGQRPWRQLHQSIEPSDATKEKEGIQALQALENNQDHSSLIIPLLSNAVQQFKKYKSPRMKRYLMVQMGEEYYHAHDYSKSITLLSRVTWDYRQERWWPLLTSILNTALGCSYLVGNVQEYITICLELMSKHTLNSMEDKARIQTNLIKMLNGQTPDAEPGCNESCVAKAVELWQAPPQPPGLYTIEMQSIVSSVECKACFTKETFTADRPVTIKVYLRVSCPLAVQFAKLSVLLNSQAYKDQCVVTSGTPQGQTVLHVHPGRTNVHTFSFLPHLDDINKSLEITSIVLEIGTSQRCAILHWTGGGGDTLAVPVHQTITYRTKKRVEPGDTTPWHLVDVHSQAKITCRESLLSVTLEHAAPALVNEIYSIRVRITNTEQRRITNIKLDVGLLEPQGIELANATHINAEGPDMEAVTAAYVRGIKMADMRAGHEVHKTVFLQATTTQDRKISVKISYDIVVDCDGHELKSACVKEEHVILHVMEPFNTHVTVASLQLSSVDSVHMDEPFLVLSDVTCTSPWPLHTHTSTYTLGEGVSFVDEQVESHVQDISLKSEDCASECQCVVVSAVNTSPLPLGRYHLSWRRQPTDANEELPFVQTTIQLPSVTVENIPLLIDLDLPAYGNVRQGMPVAYNIYNKTAYAQEIEISVESSESFMFCGQKQYHFRVLPDSKYQLKYMLVPLLPGNSPLPKLRVNMVRYPGTMDSILQKMLPSHVFIMPSGKEPATITEAEQPLAT